jgi:leucyl-tRNA synthetase
MVDDLKWPSRIKSMQKNWIGKSYGTEIDFDVTGRKWRVFTTRPDTLYGVTFLVVSAQHTELEGFVTKGQEKKVKDFLKKIRTTKQEDLDKLDKEGVFSGSYAVNPVNGEKVPVWIGNFVVADYGSGVVMAVPAHDQRDFEFATKYGIPMRVVVEPKEYEIYSRDGKLSKAYSEEGTLVNSNEFNDLETKNAKEKITESLKKKKLGRKKIQYKLRDWLISRQRYWGAPIPIIYCGECGVVPVPEKDLPVLLPEKVKFGKGNPLETNKKFLEAKCPICGKKGRRETDTMDTFFDSSWYFLRYTDNKNGKKPFDSKKLKYWNPVDQYIGGAEHATMHLMYARFFVKALRDLGFLNFDEPFTKLFNQGMLHGEDGYVMSKSRGNVVLPEEISKKYGIDTARFFLVSIVSPNKDIQWSDEGIEGSFRFVNKVVEFSKNIGKKKSKIDEKIEHKLNKSIKEITLHIESFEYNLAVIRLREFFNFLDSQENKNKEAFEIFLKLFSPFCPHITEELWEKLGNKGFLSLGNWPKFDEKKIDERFDREEKMISKLISDIDHLKKLLYGKEKKIYVYVLPNEIEIYKSVSDIELFSVADKKKYDPENKSKKVKPGRPGIYLE